MGIFYMVLRMVKREVGFINGEKMVLIGGIVS